ncbi:bifunctional riboflavin kinase/FAD synthetase [Rhodospirillaceae bacterium KN72]|uniref:Riboflavin biosynthesis protein n=1 Tax=Pacificispira spongiicola TaxID=2729598 RepID=A0A7Y0HFX2_9PROT|nr:bifunctional riboflavin kinase/FAD synthetase [Pacificispira spongiicola]NMM44332.1 bifunctional riboflavin kinase/FAD synthetase [Pacificispira spongiicola]
MQIFREVSEFPGHCRGAVIALGNFDGVHRGHQSVIGQAGEIAEEKGVPLGILTFEPHPRVFFRPDDPPFRLTPMQNKAHHLQALGVDFMVCLNFDAPLAGLDAQAFIDRILVDSLGVGTLVVGYDFKFGKGRGGDTEMLIADPRFETKVISPATSANGEVYSSTKIRDYLAEGDPGRAAALLGRPFEIEGEVLKGAQLGRTIGFPTANLELGDYVRPAYGVYAVRAGAETGRVGETIWCDGVANLGKRPTVDGLAEKFEVHIFDFNRDLYGTHLRVALIEFIRPERKFDGLDALKAQIAKDTHTAKVILDTRAAGA